MLARTLAAAARGALPRLAPSAARTGAGAARLSTLRGPARPGFAAGLALGVSSMPRLAHAAPAAATAGGEAPAR